MTDEELLHSVEEEMLDFLAGDESDDEAIENDWSMPEFEIPNPQWRETSDGVYTANGMEDVVYHHMVDSTMFGASRIRPRVSITEFYNLHNRRNRATIEEEQPRKEFDVKNKSRNKVLDEWSISARALKELIQRIVRIGDDAELGEFCTVYKFGAIYNQRYQRWFIYNKGANNNIATLKVSNNRIIVRYRPNSFYSTVLSDLNVEGFESMIVASSNLHRHNRILGSYTEHINNNRDGQMEFREERKRQHDRKHNR